MDLELISRVPEPAPSSRPSLLFIHGGFHGAWCWDEHFLPWFAEHGWAAHALSLRGHGGSSGGDRLDDWSLVDYADDVLAAMERIGGPVVLVGHSMGGVVAQICRGRRADVVGMVLLASSPLKAAPSVALKMFAKHPISMFRGMVLGNMEKAKPAFASFFFSPDMPRADRERHVGRLTAESSKAIGEIFRRDPPSPDVADGRPVLVIAGEGDWSIPMAEQEAVAKAYGATLKVCPGAHDLMLDTPWEASAQTIRDWLQDRFSH